LYFAEIIRPVISPKEEPASVPDIKKDATSKSNKLPIVEPVSEVSNSKEVDAAAVPAKEIADKMSKLEIDNEAGKKLTHKEKKKLKKEVNITFKSFKLYTNYLIGDCVFRKNMQNKWN
jgi:hypothetical protein